MDRVAIEQQFFRNSGLVSTFLVMAALCMTMLGMVMLFSAGAVRGAQDLLAKQAVWLVLAMIAAAVAAWIDLDWLKKKTPLIFCICIF